MRLTTSSLGARWAKPTTVFSTALSSGSIHSSSSCSLASLSQSSRGLWSGRYTRQRRGLPGSRMGMLIGIYRIFTPNLSRAKKRPCLFSDVRARPRGALRTLAPSRPRAPSAYTFSPTAPQSSTPLRPRTGPRTASTVTAATTRGRRARIERQGSSSPFSYSSYSQNFHRYVCVCVSTGGGKKDLKIIFTRNKAPWQKRSSFLPWPELSFLLLSVGRESRQVAETSPGTVERSLFTHVGTFSYKEMVFTIHFVRRERMREQLTRSLLPSEFQLVNGVLP